MPLLQSDTRSGGQTTGRLHYFDVFGGAVAAGIAARSVAVAIDPSWRWSATTLLVVAAFALTLGALIARRSRAYRQETPWLALSFSTAAALAMIVLFWPLHVLWFAVTVGAGCSALVFALVMRTRAMSEPVSRTDGFKLAAVGIGVVLAVAALEIGLHVAPGILGPELRQLVVADPTQYGVPHPYIGYLHRPNGATTIVGKDFTAVHKVDDRGFRNASPWPPKADIVIVGDSVTFGYGVAGERAWPAIVGAALPGIPLINLALIGAGPQQYLRVYETFGVELRPRLLIVGVFARNDFWDAEMFDLWLKSGVGGNFLVWRDFGRPGPVTLSLTHPSESLQGVFNRYLYPILRASRTYNLLRALHGSDGEGTTMYFNFHNGTRLRLLPGEFRRMSAMSERNSPAFRLALDAFARLHSLAAKNGTRVLMVLLPSKEEVYLPLIEDHVPDPTSALREALDERGVEYLDLGPAFREKAAAGERLFFEDDGHPNPEGHALIAELVLSHIKSARGHYALGDSRSGFTTSTKYRVAPVVTPTDR